VRERKKGTPIHTRWGGGRQTERGNFLKKLKVLLFIITLKDVVA
jgi:hypothetical protein